MINDFAIRSFRDNADRDYIAARMSYLARLSYPATWQSQQTIEKYLKCALLLKRVSSQQVGHNLLEALRLFNRALADQPGLSEATENFIHDVSMVGQFRYLESSYVASSSDLTKLDRAVWELRRFCTTSDVYRRLTLANGVIPPRYTLIGGLLEDILKNRKHPAREFLIRQNGFVGRPRRYVRRASWLDAVNAPLEMHPEMLDELEKFILLPKAFKTAIRSLK